MVTRKSRARRTSHREGQKNRHGQRHSSKPAHSHPSASFNITSYWRAFNSLKKNIDTAWKQLQEDIRSKANPQQIAQDNNNLTLLLGQCDYMARECMRMAAKRRGRQ